MKIRQLFPTVVTALFSGLAAIAQAQEPASAPSPFASAPLNDPQPLQQLIGLDDSEFLRRLFDTSRGPDLLDRFFPPGTVIFPMSHGFAGTQDACLRMRSAPACRLYVHDLITINEEKGPQNRVFSNPFAPLR